MNDDLASLLDAARLVEATPEHREEQRRTFALGNTRFENGRITRELIDLEAEKLTREKAIRDKSLE